jgi:Pyruvate/2-oxoacid:ferredoxin oxidoreductase delta subunit
MVDVAKFFMDFIQRESCGKCIPCREGTKQMLEILNRITQGRHTEKDTDALERFKGVVQLEQLAKVIQETSLCGLGQTAPNPVLSTLKYFKDEYDSHIFERKCPSGVCSGLISYKINPDLCKGCTLCAKKCPNGAIVGQVKQTHHIIPERCVSCGICINACSFEAVYKV